MDKGLLDSIGFWARHTLGLSLLGCPKRGTGWFFGSGSQHRLSPTAWARTVDRVVRAGFEAKQIKFTGLSGEEQRHILSAASMVCGNGRQCPDCLDERVLKVIGLVSVAELEGGK
jgi:hypothetical protein